MECVILFRNPSNGSVGFISKTTKPDEIEVFPHIDDAVELAQEHFLLRAWPFQIVELDEL